jgi:AcrR family transcriptional regulator
LTGARTTTGRRRTQDERRERTRAKLLDATIESILEVGYAGTTTRRVAELAGVSQGAQTHHFPRRVDLVGAAVERLATLHVAKLQAMAGRMTAETQASADALLDLMWRDFSSDTFAVFVKLWIAAADDPELYERLVPVERQLGRAFSEVAVTFGGKLAEAPDWDARLALTMAALGGLALTRAFAPRGRQRHNPWPGVKALLLRTLGPTD